MRLLVPERESGSPSCTDLRRSAGGDVVLACSKAIPETNPGEEPWGNRCVENRKGGNKLILHEVGSSERKGKYSQFVLGKSAGSEWRVEVKMPCEVS
jgi:hypothetical protein